MNAQLPPRGTGLLAGGRGLGLGPGWLARLWAGGLHRVLDRIDSGLAEGRLEVELPDGSLRLLGDRARGFAAEVRLVSARALLRLATGGSVGWFQAWQAGEWDSPDPVALFALFAANAKTLGNVARARGPWRWAARIAHFARRNSRRGALRNVHAHYDLGNDFYAAWLDPTMSYSGALFAQADEPLEAAQARKLKAIASRLAVHDGDRVLEIGCGWGAQARLLAERGASVDAISLSEEQLAYCRERPPMRGAVNYRKQDYRDVGEQYDAIVSVEMVEALGRRHWADFADCLARCLKPGGRGALQFIVMAEPLYAAYARGPDFIQTYVFPGGMLIHEAEFRAVLAARGLAWSDERRGGADYAQTLRLWRDNFDRAVDEGRLPAGFDHRFVRLWRYYLMYCEGGFRGGAIDMVQASLLKA